MTSSCPVCTRPVKPASSYPWGTAVFDTTSCREVAMRADLRRLLDAITDLRIDNAILLHLRKAEVSPQETVLFGDLADIITREWGETRLTLRIRYRALALRDAAPPLLRLDGLYVVLTPEGREAAEHAHRLTGGQS